MSVVNLHPCGFGPQPKFENMPRELDNSLWCVWVAKLKPNGKYDKIPSNGNQWISTAHPHQWLTKAQAQEIYQSRPGEFNGVGVLIRHEDNLTFIDVDNEDLYTVAEWIDGWPTYMERSPSGTGLRIISLGQVSRDIVKPVEVYCGHAPRFVTITGDIHHQNPVKDFSYYIEHNLLPLAPEEKPILDQEMPEAIKPPDNFTPLVFTGSDRSVELMTIYLRLLHSGKSIGEVLGLAYYSPDVHQMAMDHRNQNPDKVLQYLWTSLSNAIPRFEKEKGADSMPFSVVGAVTPLPQDTQPELDENQVMALKPISFDDLDQMYFEPVRWLVEDFLPPGVTMLVGKPKFGKSWLVHAMMLRIAAGGEMFGHPVKKSKCLYMALEDSDRRVKDRTHKLMRSMGITKPMLAGNFMHLTECAMLGAGLEEQLIEICTREPELRVITIDVLARVRAGRQQSQSLFDFDYSVGKTLKKICTLFPELSIILVHHAAKYAKDSSEATSGTNGLNAGMDNVLVLMNSEAGTPELCIHARDVENDASIPMTKDHLGMWTLDSREVATAEGQSDTRNQVLEAIDSGARSPAEIELHTDLTKKVIEQHLYRMVKGNLLRKAGRGQYVRVGVADVPSGDVSHEPTLHVPSEDMNVGSNVGLVNNQPDWMK